VAKRASTDGSDHEVADAAASLRLSATRLARRLRQEAGPGFSPSQLSALAMIAHHGPLTLGALAEREGVAPPSITKVVAKLEADGLVARSADAADRRFSHVCTTDAGEALLAEHRRRKTAWLTARIGELPVADRARLVAALEVLDHLATYDQPSAAQERP
jgi:DNA-binding MarR family transcriptional regulator